MLLQINNGAVRFAADTILEQVNFEIRGREKIAIVGRNGCGKTTLLKLIAGEVELSKRDSDEDIFIARAGKLQIGYLKQMTFEDDSLTVDEEIRKVFASLIKLKVEVEKQLELMNEDPSEKQIEKYTRLQEEFEDLGGYYYEKEYFMLFKRFGFKDEERSKKLSEFSGGQRTKIAFIKLLLSKPDVLLLDEPTNHLDISTIEWLEGYLRSYNRAVVIVSHDRMFLDKIVDVVYEIEYKKTRRYPGNYSDFVRRKRENWEKQQKDYELQQKEIRRLQTIVDKFKNKPTKVAMTRSKLKQIEHMDKIEAPERYDMKTFHSHFEPKRETGKEVLSVNELEIGYDEVLAKVSFSLSKGQKIGIIGENGIGKSTLLKTLVGQLPPLGGEYHMGYQVDVGYFDQQMAGYSSDQSVIDDFWGEFPKMTQTEVRSALGAFLFTQDEVFKQINMLSGGERVRLALAKLFKYRPNFLILDEPTNHMDIVGKETLENMLKDYSGAVLFVSHDRYFVRCIADALLVFTKEGVRFYQYGYETYLEEEAERLQEQNDLGKKESVKKASVKEEKIDNESGEETPLTQMQMRERAKEEARKQKQLQKLEEEISKVEEEIEALNEEMLKPENATNYSRVAELQEEIQEKQTLEEKLMSEWEALQ